MKKAIIAIGLVMLTGCAGLNQPLTSEQTHHGFVCANPLDRAQAFDKIEVALAEVYNDLPRVLKLRQAETETFIIKALSPFTVGGQPKDASYTLKIAVNDDRVLMDFDITDFPEIGIYSRAAQIPVIRGDFAIISNKVAESISSRVRAQ